MPTEAIPRVVEKHYSMKDLACLVGHDAKWWRERAKAGELTLSVEGDPDGPPVTIAEPREIGGEIFVPASAVNAYLARHPYRYDAGVKARNTAELRRKLAKPGRAFDFAPPPG